jgi:NitT/TauT family transport system ATP-binding protein
MKETDKLLRVEDMYKTYPGNGDGPKKVLENIDLHVSTGEFITVVGPSGCGKSTLLKIILGQEKQTSGTILLDGNPIGAPDTHRGIVYQKPMLFDHLTVIQQVMFGPRLRSGFLGYYQHNGELREKAMEYLEMVKLADDASKYPDELSGGMTQRVAIAQALIMEPRILLMDEPFSALDAETTECLEVEILEIYEKMKTSIFFVTHNLEQALFLGTRLIVLSKHYTDARGEKDSGGRAVKRGARIVTDFAVSGEDKVSSMAVKNSLRFRVMIDEIKNSYFNPKNLKRVTDFNLSHPDSFQTLTQEEVGGV